MRKHFGEAESFEGTTGFSLWGSIEGKGMWPNWLPWKYILRSAARRHKFLDPVAPMARLQRFSEPSEVAAPTELLRSGAVLHARGLMNSQAIQHNLDWVWPFWVERQFDPEDASFVPRAFSITHINLTHRNWTAIGLPDTLLWPIVDPRGLLTPAKDGWSLDAWIDVDKGAALLPSRQGQVYQQASTEGNLAVITEMKNDFLSLIEKAEVMGNAKVPVCRMTVIARSAGPARLVVALRPYNPEGVSFIHDIALQDNAKGWIVNEADLVGFSDLPDQLVFSDYRKGDVFRSLPGVKQGGVHAPGVLYKDSVHCRVGMATAAALFELSPDEPREIIVDVPLVRIKKNQDVTVVSQDAADRWRDSERNLCKAVIPDEKFRFLFEIALRTLILHSPEDIYPGPFTYKRFWFRDAAFILNALLCAGLTRRARRCLNKFPSRQTRFGYFLSQEGEWDSNGEALWAFWRYCQLTGQRPDDDWKDAIFRGAKWISRKRLPARPPSAHAGLLPPGFSAEHLGPNDYYYWDDFWGVAGLNAAAALAKAYREDAWAGRFQRDARDLLSSVEASLDMARERLSHDAIPAAPYRRMDAGAIGSIVADYPLRIYPAGDKRVLATVDFLMRNCLVKGGFFQDMTHSGINPYLTLHLAQVLLRAKDPRYLSLMAAVARLASSTGQWPEAVHPATGGGCMGDGQHVWAAAEWVMMVRNCFVREDDEEGRLILCSGIPSGWLETEQVISFGPTPTPFGDVAVTISPGEKQVTVEWKGQWFMDGPVVDIHLPGYEMVRAQPGQALVHLDRQDRVEWGP